MGKINDFALFGGMIKVLLVDDEVCEKDLIEHQLKLCTDDQYELDHALKCSQALKYLNTHTYDLVLLDNMLSQRISGQFTVPVIRSHSGVSPLVIVSNCVDVDYLANPSILQIDSIVEKKHLPAFLKGFYRQFCNRVNVQGAPEDFARVS